MAVPIIEDDGAHVFIVGGHSQVDTWDIGTYMGNQVAHYLGHEGTSLVYDTCLEDIFGCDFEPQPLGTWGDLCEGPEDCYSGVCDLADEMATVTTCAPQDW